MKLTIPERIALFNILPVQGNVVTLRIVQKLRTDLAFSEEEHKRFGVKNTIAPDGSSVVSWNPKMTEKTKDIEISDVAKGIIVSQLKSMNDRNMLHVSMLPIYEKFVEGAGKT